MSEVHIQVPSRSKPRMTILLKPKTGYQRRLSTYQTKQRVSVCHFTIEQRTSTVWMSEAMSGTAFRLPQMDEKFSASLRAKRSNFRTEAWIASSLRSSK